MLQENEDTIVESKKVAEIFNDYFANVASSIGFDDRIFSTQKAIEKHENHPSVLKIKGKFGNSNTHFSFKEISSECIKSKLKNINIRKATGFDNIPGKILRIAHDPLSGPFSSLINTCIKQNIFPNNMKCAEVSPIFKKADNLSKSNYRPVSVLTVMSKVYESVMNDQLTDYFSNLFEELLSAFRKSFSCQSLLMKCIEDWKMSLDNNNIIGTLFMDLSKAFDCLSHSLLVAKLHAYGLDISACELIASYLSDRRQRVKLGTTRSDWTPLVKGVPQGSILGPLLFNIFLNDMFYFMERCILYNYADDNSMSHAAKTLHEVKSSLQHDGEIAIKWFSDNGMQANPEKFQFMVISRSDPGIQEIVLPGNIIIKSETHVKLLGVLIDQQLNFTAHVSGLCKKAAKQLNALSRISGYIDTNSRHIIYKSFIASNFNYCPIVWHFCGKRNTDKLEKMQERALRIILKDYSSTYEELLDTACTSPLVVNRLRNILCEVFRSVKHMNPKYVCDMFSINRTKYSTRNPLKLVQSMKHTTTYGLRTFSYAGARLWNSSKILDGANDLNDISLNDFKSRARGWNGPAPDDMHCFI